MAVIVKKFGGTSVGSPERIRNVARLVAGAQARGNRVAVVVSAMSGETDRLLKLSQAVAPKPDAREQDVLVATGEQVTIALLAIALRDLGCPARSFTGKNPSATRSPWGTGHPGRRTIPTTISP